jgi:TonB family protein
MLPADKIVISICSPEEPASPENGYRFYELVGQKLRYPAEARRKHIEGKVFVEFVVTKDGKAIDFKVIKGEAGGLNEEAIRVMKEIDMRWKPAVLNGQKVPSLMVLPLSFKLG